MSTHVIPVGGVGGGGQMSHVIFHRGGGKCSRGQMSMHRNDGYNSWFCGVKQKVKKGIQDKLSANLNQEAVKKRGKLRTITKETLQQNIKVVLFKQ